MSEPDERRDSWDFRLDDWEVRVADGTVRREEEVVHLEPRVMKVLQTLAEHPGEVVPREEFLERVWEGAFVEDGALSRCVFDIRQALGDEAHAPRYVETIPRRGYRLVCTVKDRSKAERQTSVAVLPFLDLSPESDQGYFADGLAEEIIHALTQVRSLRVVARTSAFSLRGKNLDVREIGKTLGVSSILEGSVRKANGRLRVAVQLVHTEDGFHLWSERYDLEASDVFRLQDEIARTVVHKTLPSLLPSTRLVSPSTKSLPAYDLYLGARARSRDFTADAFEGAKALLEEAIDLDPAFAAAHAWLAVCCGSLSILDEARGPKLLEIARRHADEAIELDESLAAGYAARTMICLFQWDWELAKESGRLAVELRPGFAFARDMYRVALQASGQTRRAVAQARLAYELDPLSARNLHALGTTLLLDRRYQEAIDSFERTLERNAKMPYTHILLAAAHWHLGHRREALDLIRQEFRLAGDVAAVRRFESGDVLDELRAWLQRCTEIEALPGRRFWAAVFNSWLGDTHGTIAALETACAAHDYALLNVKAWPSFDAICDDPRFRGVLRKMGLVGD